MLSFTERMQQGRDLAIERRNRGLPTGTHDSWNYKRSPMSPLDKLYMETYRLESIYSTWQKLCQRRLDIRYIGMIAVDMELSGFDELARETIP